MLLQRAWDWNTSPYSASRQKHAWHSFHLLARIGFCKNTFFKETWQQTGADDSRDFKDAFWTNKCTRGQINSGLTTPLEQILFRVLPLTHTFFSSSFPPVPFISPLIYLDTECYLMPRSDASNYNFLFFFFFSTDSPPDSYVSPLCAELQESSTVEAKEDRQKEIEPGFTCTLVI